MITKCIQRSQWFVLHMANTLLWMLHRLRSVRIRLGSNSKVQRMSLSRKSRLTHPSFRHFSFAICSETDRWKSSLRLGIHPQSILIYHHCFQSVLLIVSHCETLFIHHLRYSIKLLFFLAYSCCLGSGPNSR